MRLCRASGTLRNKQRCAPEADFLARITWFEDLGGGGGGRWRRRSRWGVFFSNELVDAFPVRCVTYRSGEWLEQFVGITKGELDWVNRPIEDVELRRAIAGQEMPEIEKYTTEFNLRARAWIGEVARALVRGYVLTIDYGYPAELYYAAHRTDGTLTAFVKHHAIGDVLAEPGMRDLTAHVDFTALARCAEAAGLETLGFLDQQHFLMGVAHDELSGGGGAAGGDFAEPGGVEYADASASFGRDVFRAGAGEGCAGGVGWVAVCAGGWGGGERLKRPYGTRGFGTGSPAMNYRATFNHSYGMSGGIVSPFQGWPSLKLKPRALPWANLFRPFGAADFFARGERG